MVGDSPIRPALMAVPMGAFVMAELGDLWYLLSRDVFWYELVPVALVVGLSAGLVAAMAEVVDFFLVAMSARRRRLASFHLLGGLTALALFALSLILRWNGDSLEPHASWSRAATLSVAAVGVLGIAAWLGGRMRSEPGTIQAVDQAPRRATEARAVRSS